MSSNSKCKNPTQNRYSNLKGRAKSRGILFDLDPAEFEEWFDDQDEFCHYCGVEFSYIGKRKRNTFSVDRIDNDEGYSIGNIVPCCCRCNTIKSYDIPYYAMLEMGDIISRIDKEN